MKKIEKYTGEKVYMFPNGHIATPEAVLEHFPAATVFTHIVETDEAGETMWAMQNLSAIRSIHNLDPMLSEAEAILAYEAILNTPLPAPEPSAAERQAAALEFIAINSMADIV